MLTCDILLAIYEARTPTQTPDATRVVCVGGTPNHRVFVLHTFNWTYI